MRDRCHLGFEVGPMSLTWPVGNAGQLACVQNSPMCPLWAEHSHSELLCGRQANTGPQTLVQSLAIQQASWGGRWGQTGMSWSSGRAHRYELREAVCPGCAGRLRRQAIAVQCPGGSLSPSEHLWSVFSPSLLHSLSQATITPCPASFPLSRTVSFPDVFTVVHYTFRL